MQVEEAKRLIDAYSGRLPSEPPRSLAPWERHALDIAWSLFPRERLMRLPDGTVILGLADGRHLGLVVLPVSSVNAFADPYGQIDVAALLSGAAKALWQLAAAIWTNPTILPGFGATAGLADPQPIDAVIPRGFEHVWAAAQAVLPPSERSAVGSLDIMPGWMREGCPSLCARRALAFQRTLVNALRFFWLHEIGHVLGGHLDLRARSGRRRMAEGLSVAHGPAEPHPALVAWALEIEADRFATTRLQESAKRTRHPFADCHEQTFVSIGAALMPLVFHAHAIFAQRPDRAETHPPLWFRARDVLRSEHLGALTGPSRAAEILLGLANSHMLLGEWLGPVLDEAYREPAEAIEADVCAARAGVAPALGNVRTALRPRPDGIAPVDLFTLQPPPASTSEGC